jgi:hypothetical protein
MKLYRDFIVNIAAGWFFTVFAATTIGNSMQALLAAMLCLSCILLAEELDRWDA